MKHLLRNRFWFSFETPNKLKLNQNEVSKYFICIELALLYVQHLEASSRMLSDSWYASGWGVIWKINSASIDGNKSINLMSDQFQSSFDLF
jgi:hypothetical protein